MLATTGSTGENTGSDHMLAKPQSEVQAAAAALPHVHGGVMEQVVAKARMKAEAIEAAKINATDAAKVKATEAATATSNAGPRTQAAVAQTPPLRGDWEFLWRFIAVAMVFEICWVVWIAIQINPPLFVLPAAYAAAAKAGAPRHVDGQIRNADEPPRPVVAPVSAWSEFSSAPAAPREPLVNVEKLKLAESIGTAIPEHPEKSASPRPQ